MLRLSAWCSQKTAKTFTAPKKRLQKRPQFTALARLFKFLQHSHGRDSIEQFGSKKDSQLLLRRRLSILPDHNKQERFISFFFSLKLHFPNN